MHTCVRCQESKPAERFPHDIRNGVRRRRSACYDCKARRDKEKVKEYNARYRANNLEKVKAAARKCAWKRYGINPELAEAYYQSHNGMCEICNTSSETALCMDHDHITGQIRGMLCGNCNRAIGLLGDTYEGVLRAANYLLTARNNHQE